jgi:hypothetical protein
MIADRKLLRRFIPSFRNIIEVFSYLTLFIYTIISVFQHLRLWIGTHTRTHAYTHTFILVCVSDFTVVTAWRTVACQSRRVPTSLR